MCTRDAHDSERQFAIPLLALRVADVAEQLRHGTGSVMNKHEGILTAGCKANGEMSVGVLEKPKETGTKIPASHTVTVLMQTGRRWSFRNKPILLCVEWYAAWFSSARYVFEVNRSSLRSEASLHVEYEVAPRCTWHACKHNNTKYQN
jgi:hypothetical protein